MEEQNNKKKVFNAVEMEMYDLLWEFYEVDDEFKEVEIKYRRIERRRNRWIEKIQAFAKKHPEIQDFELYEKFMGYL